MLSKYAIAVAASWPRTGKAALAVPRMPTLISVGKRGPRLQIDPRALREWAMAPLAVVLGLAGGALQAERPGLPVRAFVPDVLASRDSLPEHCVYVGRGSFHHRLQGTKWKSPWTPGHNCATDDWLALYIQHIRTSDLWHQLAELQGQTLVCDCPLHQMCEADALIGLYSDACQPCSGGTQSVSTPQWSRTVMLLQGINSLPKSVALPLMSQEAVALAFRKLFPREWFSQLKFAMVEDLLNGPPFTSFPAWLAAQGERWDRPTWLPLG